MLLRAILSGPKCGVFPVRFLAHKHTFTHAHVLHSMLSIYRFVFHHRNLTVHQLTVLASSGSRIALTLAASFAIADFSSLAFFRDCQFVLQIS